VIAHDEVRELLSAYLDGELTQAAAQRVRIHLEDCAECRAAYAELEKLRRVTAEMKFAGPPEDKMSELEQKLSVQAPRRIGWLLLVAGFAVWAAYAAYLFVVDPKLATFEKLTTGAMVIGLVLLLISVLRQRLLEMPHDRYRGVKR
jgi:anti-sigma factor RsiW